MKTKMIINAVTVLALWLALTGPAAADGTNCARLPRDAHLPDLQTVVPSHLNLVNQQQSEILRFSNGIANTGKGPLELHPLSQDPKILNDAQQNIYNAETAAAGAAVCSLPLTAAFFFHPEHNHWHLDNVARFEVRPAEPNDGGFGGQWGAVFGQSVKATFCLIDWVPMNGSKPGSRVYGSCFGDQGISVDWVDQYHQSTEFQDVDITHAPPGIYYLVSTVNPVEIFLESNYANNVAWVSFELLRDSNGNPKIDLISHSTCTGDLCGYSTNR
jgi:hypothetical protein